MSYYDTKLCVHFRYLVNYLSNYAVIKVIDNNQELEKTKLGRTSEVDT